MKFFNCILASAAPAFNIPKWYKDVTTLSVDGQCQWSTAMQEEMSSLQDRKVWDLVNLPPGCKPVKGKWVYVVKSNGQHRAHFIAKEFTQIYKIPALDFRGSNLSSFMNSLRVSHQASPACISRALCALAQELSSLHVASCRFH